MKKKFEINEATVCCKVCGGLNVEKLAWLDLVTNKITDDLSSADGGVWCRDCQDHTGLMFKTEWDSQNGKE